MESDRQTLRTCRVVTARVEEQMSHALCKQRVVWDHTQLGGVGKGIRASKEKEASRGQ